MTAPLHSLIFEEMKQFSKLNGIDLFKFKNLWLNDLVYEDSVNFLNNMILEVLVNITEFIAKF